MVSSRIALRANLLLNLQNADFFVVLMFHFVFHVLSFIEHVRPWSHGPIVQWSKAVDLMQWIIMSSCYKEGVLGGMVTCRVNVIEEIWSQHKLLSESIHLPCILRR